MSATKIFPSFKEINQYLQTHSNNKGVFPLQLPSQERCIQSLLGHELMKDYSGWQKLMPKIVTEMFAKLKQSSVIPSDIFLRRTLFVACSGLGNQRIESGDIAKCTRAALLELGNVPREGRRASSSDKKRRTLPPAPLPNQKEIDAYKKTHSFGAYTGMPSETIIVNHLSKHEFTKVIAVPLLSAVAKGMQNFRTEEEGIKKRSVSELFASHVYTLVNINNDDFKNPYEVYQVILLTLKELCFKNEKPMPTPTLNSSIPTQIQINAYNKQFGNRSGKTLKLLNQSELINAFKKHPLTKNLEYIDQVAVEVIKIEKQLSRDSQVQVTLMNTILLPLIEKHTQKGLLIQCFMIALTELLPKAHNDSDGEEIDAPSEESEVEQKRFELPKKRRSSLWKRMTRRSSKRK